MIGNRIEKLSLKCMDYQIQWMEGVNTMCGLTGFVHNSNVCGFLDLSKKTRAGKSCIWAVLRPPDLSR